MKSSLLLAILSGSHVENVNSETQMAKRHPIGSADLRSVIPHSYEVNKVSSPSYGLRNRVESYSHLRCIAVLLSLRGGHLFNRSAFLKVQLGRHPSGRFCKPAPTPQRKPKFRRFLLPSTPAFVLVAGDRPCHLSNMGQPPLCDNGWRLLHGYERRSPARPGLASADHRCLEPAVSRNPRGLPAHLRPQSRAGDDIRSSGQHPHFSSRVCFIRVPAELRHARVLFGGSGQSSTCATLGFLDSSVFA